MPLEQACLSGREPRASSKHVKDRSNAATLLASRSTADTESYRRGSRCGSEKDSGYSDNSCTDWLHVDREDQGSSANEPRGREGLQGQVKPGGPDLTPIFIIKNVVLKQNGSDHHLQNQLNWENRGGSSNESGPCHVILVQQPSEASPSPASPKPHRTQSRRADSTARKTKSRTYLPILKSYPRIAPHPSKKPSDKTPVDPHVKGTGNEDQSQDKRDELRHHHRLLLLLFRWLLSPPGQQVARRHSPGLSQFSAARDRRFLNTVGILSQSGLLDITLRTQDLLRQTNATDRDITQLRQHTQLLLQATNHHNNNNPNNNNPSNNNDNNNPYNNNSPKNNDPNANTANAGWERIHQAMAQSGCYPSLKNLGSEEDHHSYSPEPGVGRDASFKRDSVGPNIATHTHNGLEAPAPPSPLLAPISDLLPQYCPVSLAFSNQRHHVPLSLWAGQSQTP
ncbi:hypothetical protein J4Q44_G00338680 [Coregonus suidteri]|uniref:Uncharacterized protein n=1 Tax=Coregonus suidteri TaxID=861788 RepID=A0AAN8L296_9TELE